MDGATLKQLQNVEFEILKAFDEYCRGHDIKYSLAGGSLLGAVRHGGFIPWDDDIDIQMPRPDFKRFQKEFHNQGNLRFVAPGDSDSRYHYGKVIRTDTIKIEPGFKYNNDYLGVDIDVFIIDGAPDNKQEFNKLKKKIFKAYNIFGLVISGFQGTIRHKVEYLLNRVVYGSPRSILSKAFNLCEKFDYYTSNYLAYYPRYSRGFRVPAKCFAKFIYKDFEGYKFRVPVGYDAILKAEYGDYMKLPPENERVTHHQNMVYWK